MKLVLIVSACIAHLLLTETSAVPAQDCGEIFQSQLRQLVTTKQSCDSASFYDCCQVMYFDSYVAKHFAYYIIHVQFSIR